MDAVAERAGVSKATSSSSTSCWLPRRCSSAGTYEGFVAAWPSMTDEVGFAEKMNGMPKYVVSKTLESADWNNSTVIRGNVADEVSKLREQPGGDILVAGSAHLVNTPIVLGGGKRLFADAETTTAPRAVDVSKAGDCLIVTYEPARG